MKQRKLVQISDIIYTAVIVVVCLVIWFFSSVGGKGNTVVIRKDGEVLAELPLAADAEYEVAGKYTNIFAIQDGEVFVTYTDCPNHQCEKTGAVSADGASIVCAPNRVSATITGKGAQVDAYTG